jgi:predicted RNase H-like HicB family nuclease
MVAMESTFAIEFDLEDDGRWIAEIPDLPGVLSYGMTRDQARMKIEALARQVIAERTANE